MKNLIIHSDSNLQLTKETCACTTFLIVIFIYKAVIKNYFIRTKENLSQYLKLDTKLLTGLYPKNTVLHKFTRYPHLKSSIQKNVVAIDDLSSLYIPTNKMIKRGLRNNG